MNKFKELSDKELTMLLDGLDNYDSGGYTRDERIALLNEICKEINLRDNLPIIKSLTFYSDD